MPLNKYSEFRNFNELLSEVYPKKSSADVYVFDRLEKCNDLKIRLHDNWNSLIEELNSRLFTVFVQDRTRITDNLEPSLIFHVNFKAHDTVLAVTLSTVGPFWGCIVSRSSENSFFLKSTESFMQELKLQQSVEVSMILDLVESYFPNYAFLGFDNYYLEFSDYVYPSSGGRTLDPHYLFYFLFGDSIV